MHLGEGYAADGNGASGGIEDAGQQAQQRRLAGAVRSENADHAALDPQIRADQGFNRRRRQVESTYAARPSAHQRAGVTQKPAARAFLDLTPCLGGSAVAGELPGPEQQCARGRPKGTRGGRVTAELG